MTNSAKIYDIAVIGAGPVGLFMVFAAGMRGLNCLVLDALPDIGGQCTALYPDKPIYDIPAFGEIEAAELIERLEKQAAPFSPHYALGAAVTGLMRGADGVFALTNTRAETYHAKAIVIAAGNGAFGPQRPPLENLAAYENKSVFYAIRNRQVFVGEKVVIAGGGDSAVDWAIHLAGIASSVSLVHRRDVFKAAPASLAELDKLAAAGKVKKYIPCQLASLKGDTASGALSHVVLKNINGGEEEIECTKLLPFFGISAQLGPIADWGLSLARHQIVVDFATCATSVSGIFAIGDIAFYPHKLKLIMTGFAEAAQAAQAIYSYIHPDHEVHHVHSTTKGLPQSPAG